MRGPHNIIRLIRTGATLERTGAMKVILDALDVGPILRIACRSLVWPFQWLGIKGDTSMPPATRALTALGPAYIKFGQVLSTRPDVVGDELAVREDLEIAIGMGRDDVEELRVHEGFAADETEEIVAHFLRFVDQLVHGLKVDRLLLRGDIDPAALTSQIATVDDRDVQEGRKDDALLEPRPLPLQRRLLRHHPLLR